MVNDGKLRRLRMLELLQNESDEQHPIAGFSEKAFQLFDGERTQVTLLCHEDAMNSVLDHFGDKAKTRQTDETHFELIAEVSLSPTFFAWVFQFGGKIKIRGPEEVCKGFQALLSSNRCE